MTNTFSTLVEEGIGEEVAYLLHIYSYLQYKSASFYMPLGHSGSFGISEYPYSDKYANSH